MPTKKKPIARHRRGATGHAKRKLIEGLPDPMLMSDDDLMAEIDAMMRADEKSARRWACDRPHCDGSPHEGWLHRHARASQRVPDWTWTTWLLMTGRGWGKTRTAAETVKEWAQKPNQFLAVVAKNETLVREICFESKKSGLLAVLDPDDIASYSRSTGNVHIVMKNGTIIRGFGGEVPDNLRGWAFDKAWCVAKGTLVETEDGPKPIEDVEVGERVWTRAGLREVTASGRTKRDAPTLTIVTSTGERVSVTAEHKVWTTRGWVRAGELVPGDTMLAWNPSQDPRTGTTSTAPAGGATSGTATTTATAASSSTSPSGNTPTDLSPTATRSTTTTETAPTMPSATSAASPAPSTDGSTSNSGPTTRTTRGSGSPLTRLANMLLACGRRASRAMWSAWSAARSSSRPGCERNAAPTPAGASTNGSGQPTSVLAVEPGPTVDVYDLTVDGEHEFYAGGLLVHNCDEYAAWNRITAQAVYDMLWFCLREAAEPQVIISTTPKPLPHVKKLVERNRAQVKRLHEQAEAYANGELTDADLDAGPRVVITSGHTNENADNLSGEALEELDENYTGTRLGRQELSGELLEDIEGALWQQWMFEVEGFRIEDRGDVPPIQRLVIGVDPATTTTDQADETGICVAGRGFWRDTTHADQRPRGYVFHAEAQKRTPMQTMQRVAELYHQLGADCVILEANNGGEYLSTVLQMIDSTVNYRIVNASRDKRARATPVAGLYEQARMHHVGPVKAHNELESVMTTYVGAPESQEKSPDILDAAVWAMWDLFLDPGNQLQRPGRDRRSEGRR